jgi:hypothetical protein
MSAGFEQSRWMELPIRCPHCGNHGEPDGPWEANAWTPFKLIEEVVRSWEFMAADTGDGLRLTVNACDESIDGESGTSLCIECMQCFNPSRFRRGRTCSSSNRALSEFGLSPDTNTSSPIGERTSTYENDGLCQR